MVKYIFDVSEFKFEFECKRNWKLGTHLLHMPKHILPAVKHALSFLGVQVKDELRGVVFIASLISAT